MPIFGEHLAKLLHFLREIARLGAAEKIARLRGEPAGVRRQQADLLQYLHGGHQGLFRAAALRFLNHL